MERNIGSLSDASGISTSERSNCIISSHHQVSVDGTLNARAVIESHGSIGHPSVGLAKEVIISKGRYPACSKRLWMAVAHSRGVKRTMMQIPDRNERMLESVQRTKSSLCAHVGMDHAGMKKIPNKQCQMKICGLNVVLNQCSGTLRPESTWQAGVRIIIHRPYSPMILC